MSRIIEIGVVSSTHGTYRHIAKNAFMGVLHAVDVVNSLPRMDFQLRVRHIDPADNLAVYNHAVQELSASGVSHLFGLITSASRKEMVPELEQYNSLLWYGSPYEGYESSENVIYLNSCPNQALLPLLRWALEHIGSHGYLIGSNYVWGWESNRIAIEALGYAKGEVVGEKYLGLGHLEFDEIVTKLLLKRPHFVLNNLVGESSYAFLRALNRACQSRQQPLPVLSCNLTEAEAGEVCGLHSLRLISCGPFFAAAAPEYCARQNVLHGWKQFSHFYTSNMLGIWLFAHSVMRAGSTSPDDIKAALWQGPIMTPLGEISVSSDNNHSRLPCYIGEFVHDEFQLIHKETSLLEPDPYLTATNLHCLFSHSTGKQHQILRVVK